ncbi:MAG: ABC transporter ATP-binding protein [Myxococcota bacterium]
MKQVALRSVVVEFGKVRALAGVDVDARSGEVVLFAGPNGAGKSTLIRVMLGLVRPQAGHLEVDGVAHRVDNAFKRTLGYLPEAVAFAENLTGRQVLRFFARARGVSNARVDAVLERVDLSGAAKRAVRGYSRGMRQRLGLGLSILAEPELLILDEPTGGLDQAGLVVLWSILTEWREAGRMVVVSSHDLTLLERRVDRLCLLREGRVVAFDSPEKLRELAALPLRVTFGLATDRAQAADFAAAVDLALPGARRGEYNGALTVEVAPGGLLPLMDVRGSHADAVLTMRVEEPGLDQIYEHLLKAVR